MLTSHAQMRVTTSRASSPCRAPVDGPGVTTHQHKGLRRSGQPSRQITEGYAHSLNKCDLMPPLPAHIIAKDSADLTHLARAGHGHVFGGSTCERLFCLVGAARHGALVKQVAILYPQTLLSSECVSPCVFGPDDSLETVLMCRLLAGSM